MSHLKYLFFLFLFLLSARIYSQDPNWNSLLIIPSNPSPYISDWENNPNNISYSIEYLGQGNTTIILEFSIYSDNLGELLNGASNEIDFTGQQQQYIRGTDLVNWDETTWNKSVEEQVIRTGLFPEGHYTACIEAYDLNDNLLTKSCQEFTISYPDPPYLIAPLSGDSVNTQFPTFQWSPVINTFSNDPVTYKIRIVELLKGQTPQQAITANYPHFEGEINITTLSYPPSAQLLEKNKTYVWQVQALNEDDLPAATNNGQSEIWSFKYIDKTYSDLLSLYVNFTKNTISYSPNNLSNSVDIDLLLQGSTTETLAIDSVVTYWYNKSDNSLYKVMHATISPIINLTSGLTFTRNVKLALDNASLTTALAGKQKSEYYVNIVYIGKDQNGNRITGKTQAPLNVVCLSGTTSNLQAEFFDNTITISPDNLSNTEKITLFYQANSNETATIDSVITYWFNKDDNSLYKVMKAAINPVLTLTGGITLTRYANLILDNESLTTALAGKQKAEYYINIEYIGKDNNKNRIVAKTNTPLNVVCLANSLSGLQVEFVNKTIIYTPDTLSNYGITKLSFKSLVSQTLTIDSLVNYWYRKKDNSLYATIRAKAIPTAVLTSGLTITRQGLMTLSYANLTSGLEGKSTAEYYVHMEYIGKDNNGLRVTGKTQTPLLVKLFAQNEKYNNLAEFITKEIKFTPDNLQNKVKIKFTHFTDLTSPYIEVDSSIFYWYNEDNSLFFKDKDQTSFQPFKVDYTPSLFEIEPYFDLQSFNSALNGRDSATYKLHLEFIGKEKDGKKVSVKTISPLIVKFYAKSENYNNIVEFITKEIKFAPNILQNKVKIKFTHYVDLTSPYIEVDSSIFCWYNEDNSLFFKDKDQTSFQPFKVDYTPSLFEIEPYFDLQSFNSALNGRDSATYKLHLEFIGKEKDGKKVFVKTKSPLIVKFYASNQQLLDVKYSQKLITYSPDNLTNKLDVNIEFLGSGSVTLDSVINYWYKKGNSSLYKKLPSVISPSVSINGGSSLIRPVKLTLSNSDLTIALDGKAEAEYYVNMVYIGKDQNGNKITGTSKSPLNVKCYATPQLDPDSTYYTIIPKIAVIKPLKGQTTITKSDSKVTFNGSVKLILSSSPFKNDSAFVTATNLTFTKDSVGYKVSGGSFYAEAAPKVEKELFNFKFKKVLKIQVQRLSYNYNSVNKLLIKQAFSIIPVIDKRLYFKDLLIDKNGLQLKVSKQELKAFGLVFVVKNFSNIKSPSGNSKISLGVGLRLAGDTLKAAKKEFFSGELVIQKVKGGETTVDLKGANGGGKPLIRLIPTTDYLNFNSFKFVKKPNKDWIMQVGVSSANLPIYSKINKDPINLFFEYEKSGKMSGKVEFVNETQHGYNKDDKTVFEIGKLGAIDLTYLGFKLEQVQEITTIDAKPDTSWKFDINKCQIAISADLYLASKGKKLNDLTNAIYFGEPGHPGITIDFEGNVKTQTISLTKEKKLDLGPVFLHMTKLAVVPYPFELAISGGIGVAMKNVFSGEVIIKNLKINNEGKLTNLDKAVNGGNLSILKVLELKIDKLQFSSTPTTLTYSKNTGSSTSKTSIQVNNYFLLEGANLRFGKNGAAGGKLKRLLIYEASNNQNGSSGSTNFILNEGTMYIKNAIDLTIDIEYVKGSQGEHLGVGGTVKLFSNDKNSGYGGTVYGEIGNRINGADTTDYWGFYVQANLGKGIPLGPVNLTGVGGGFFYHPTKGNIQKVTSLAGFTPLKITGVDSYGKPKLSKSQEWALFLYASMSIAGPDLIHGKAFITVTNSYFKLNAEVKAIKEKAHGKAFLNINWAQEFVEGKFQFGIDLVVIKAEEKNNYFQFYAYSKSKWGVMGKTDIKCFLIKTTSDIYVGNQGFLFDFALEESIDIYVISGGFRIEAMTWWRKNVNWGIYASGKAWGDVLGGLIGAEIGVEGALISNPFLIYIGGHLKVTVCWVDVFSGRAWITISEDGLDGGTGGNAKFDKLISDARNVGKQMKKSMDDLKKELQAAREALYQLNDAQRLVAGKTLLQISGWLGEKGFLGGIAYLYREMHEHDLYVKTISEPVDTTKQIGEGALRKVFNMVWNSQLHRIYKLRTKLQQDSIAIANAIDDIQSMENELNSLISSQSELFTGELPTLSKLNKLKSPVTEPTLAYSTMTINDTVKQVTTFDYSLDSAATETLVNTVSDQKKELEAYQNKLVSMVGEYQSKLKEIENILYSGNSSVSSIAKKYATTFDEISNYTFKFMDYLNEQTTWSLAQVSNMPQMEPAIIRDIDAQATIAGWATSDKFKRICKQRIALINGLIKTGVAKNFAPPIDSISMKNYKDMGKELYYNIPKAGFSSINKETPKIREQFSQTTKANYDLYFAKWNGFTQQSDKVYAREAKLYTILYDLFDQLSLEAGTRKLEKAYSNDMIVSAESGSTSQNTLIPIVSDDGVVSIGPGSSYSVIAGPTFESSSNNFEQVVQSTGDNSFQNQRDASNVGTNVTWAKDWDFEKERKNIKKILEIPKIIQFSGKAYSDINTLGYSKLTLSWAGKHPIGIAEYSFAIEDYTDPIHVTTSSSGNNSDYVTLNNTDPLNALNNDGGLSVDDFFGGNSGNDNQQTYDATGSGNNDQYDLSSATLADQPSQIWFTAGQHNQIIVPFLMGINDRGTYNIAIRARGAGGYSLTRTGTVNIDYCGTSTENSDFDWSARTSSLETLDQTPPTTPSVNDGADITSSLNTLIVSWSSADYESGIQEYQYQVVYDKGTGGRNNYQEVTPWVSAGGQTELTIRLDKELIPGKTYYVLVRAKNGVDMWSDVGWSDGITLKDPTPPTKPSFTQTGRRKGNLDYVTSLNDSLFYSTWYPASDPESGVIGYLFALGTTEGASDVISWCGVKSPKIRLDKTQLKKLLNTNLQKNTTYYLSVKAMNGIGVTSEPAIQTVIMN